MVIFFGRTHEQQSPADLDQSVRKLTCEAHWSLGSGASWLSARWRGPRAALTPAAGPQTRGAAGPAGQGNRQFPGPLCTYPDEGFRGTNGRAGLGSGRAQPAQPVPCFSRRRPPGLCHPPGISVFPSAGLEEKTIIRSLGRRQRGCGTGQWRPVGQGKGLGSPRVLPYPLQHSGREHCCPPPRTLAASMLPTELTWYFLQPPLILK